MSSNPILFKHLESQVDLKSETDTYKDYKFTKWMTKNVGLQGIPPTAFYGEEHKHLGENFVRYCFIKVLGLEINIYSNWEGWVFSIL